MEELKTKEERRLLAESILDQGKYNENGDEVESYIDEQGNDIPKYEGFCDYDSIGAMIEFSDLENKELLLRNSELEARVKQLENAFKGIIGDLEWSDYRHIGVLAVRKAEEMLKQK